MPWQVYRSGEIHADVVVRFGDQYKQRSAAFDAGHAAALGKPEQLVDLLRYALTGVLPR